MKEFQIAGATVPGTDHTMPGQPGWVNNQDAFAWRVTPDGIVAVVCDGCSSAKDSEVGAKLGVRIITDVVAMLLVDFASGILSLSSTEEVAVSCRISMVEILSRINDIARRVDANYKELIESHFLFSTMCAIVTPATTMIMSCGDGVYVLNGNITTIGPYPKNAPPYLAYNLSQPNREIEFTPHVLCPTADVQSVLIGTDGVTYLQKASELLIPGIKPKTVEPIGDLSQFWINDAYFTDNTDIVRRKLARINRERVVDGQISFGPLRDDVSFITIRRTPQP